MQITSCKVVAGLLTLPVNLCLAFVGLENVTNPQGQRLLASAACAVLVGGVEP